MILPKLFGRLVDYLHLGDDSMAGLPAVLDQAADKFFILSTGHSTCPLAIRRRGWTSSWKSRATT